MKLNITALLLALFSVCTSYAQPLILDKVVAVVGKNPLLLSEVETTLLQEELAVLDSHAPIQSCGLAGSIVTEGGFQYFLPLTGTGLDPLRTVERFAADLRRVPGTARSTASTSMRPTPGE